MFLKKHYQAYLPDADIAIVLMVMTRRPIRKTLYYCKSLTGNNSRRKKAIFFAGVYHQLRGGFAFTGVRSNSLKERNNIGKLVVVGNYMKVKVKGEKATYQRGAGN
ncbi:hypothetical protein KCP71_17575 [Salmonella enterica subsp. enterica]|nr:hypothetical protein KCP71_17575 [Salmonella enterica subsp. enterica]